MVLKHPFTMTGVLLFNFYVICISKQCACTFPVSTGWKNAVGEDNHIRRTFATNGTGCCLGVFPGNVSCFADPVAQQAADATRQRVSIDQGWRFAFGHSSGTKKDFGHATSYFSYLAKAGYGDGAASQKFDDRTWRKLDLPHDWAVEQDVSEYGSFSHGFKAIGANFPDRTIGWYRKSWTVPASDPGRRISVEFDGIFRNSQIWVNGHYLGTEASGYNSFAYDITDVLHYGGENVIAVRVDAGMEEGWFYEGAGIYRHVNQGI